MSTFYKKVHAVQLQLTESELEELKAGKRFEFQGTVIKWAGGPMYFAMLHQAENQIKVQAGQWVVRHPEGAYQVLWPEEFNDNFIQAPDESVSIAVDAFAQKSYIQPTALV